jgi:L-fucose isomerase-like protein
MPHFRLRDGAVTMARFDGAGDDYLLAIGQGHTCPGPDTQNNHCWVEVDDWPHWERTLVEGPFIHHMAMVYGHYGDALQEACKYIPGLAPVRLDNSAKP